MFARFFSQPAVFPPPPHAAPDITLSDILGSVNADKCVKEYFMRRALLVSDSRASDRIGFDLQRLRSLLAMPAKNHPPNFSLDANFRSSSDDCLFSISADQVGHLLDAGATVCITNVHLIDPGLYRLTRSMKCALRFDGQVGVNCYVSGNGAGFRKHFDSKSALVIQCEGKKHWKYSSLPAIDFPRASGRPGVDGIEYDFRGREVPEPWELAERVDGETHAAVLEPGNALWLPPGAWHEACAEGFSLALTVTFKPRDFSQSLIPLLAAAMRSHSAWRAGIPAAFDASAVTAAQPHVKRYFGSRLKELRDYLNALGEEDFRLWDAWAGGITESLERPSATVSAELRGDAVYAWNPVQPTVAYLRDDGPLVHLVVHGQSRRWKFLDKAAPVVDAIKAGPPLTLQALAGAVAPQLSEAEVREVVGVLLDAGVLAEVSASGAAGEVQ
jgi:hypothetical protein